MGISPYNKQIIIFFALRARAKNLQATLSKGKGWSDMIELDVSKEKKPFCPVKVNVFVEMKNAVLTASTPYNGTGIYDDTEFGDPFGG